MDDAWEPIMKHIETAKPRPELASAVRARTRALIARRTPARSRPMGLYALVGVAAAALVLVTILVSGGSTPPRPPAFDAHAVAAMDLPSFVEGSAGIGHAALPTHKDPGPQASPYVAHEWGVIGLGVRGAAEIAAALRKDLPPFVRDASPGSGATFHAPPTHKPVLYFYPTLAAGFHPDVRVKIPGGRITHFWPPGDASRGALFYRHNVFWNQGIDPKNARAVKSGHWMATARDTDAAWLQVTVVKQAKPGSPEVVRETERFLFYDGQVPYVAPLRLERVGSALRIHHAGREPLGDVILIDRSPGRTRIGHVATLAAGAAHTFALRSVADPSAFLVKRLEAAGLYRKEAVGMAAIWREEFFGRTGRWLLWRLAPETVEGLMPLTLTPRPTDLKRVHLVFAPVHAELGTVVAGLVRRLGGVDADAAIQTLRALGPGICVYLLSYQADQDPEVRRHTTTLLEELGRPR